MASIFQRTKGGAWWIKYHVSGRQVYYSLGTQGARVGAVALGGQQYNQPEALQVRQGGVEGHVGERGNWVLILWLASCTVLAGPSGHPYGGLQNEKVLTTYRRCRQRRGTRIYRLDHAYLGRRKSVGGYGTC